MTNLEKYEGILDGLSRESGKMAWSSGIWTFFFIVLIVIISTAIIRIFAPFANMLVMLFIFVAEGIALFIPLGLYFHRAGNYMQDRCLELEYTHPGILDAYDEWKQKQLEKISV
ncbi:hypothetical protein BH10ACI1_BH10ACI1_25910 [soil metagenome]